MLVLGSHLAHRSAENKTDKSRSSLYATFHSRSDGEDLREQYYKHRMEIFPPEHGELFFGSSEVQMNEGRVADIYLLEREDGKDYSKGYQTYGFAAPFTKAQENVAATVDVA
jgi:hypothetical protein